MGLLGVWMVVATSALASCASSDEPSSSPMPRQGQAGMGQAGTGQAGTGSEPACHPMPCSCPGELTGQTECPSGECRCDVCPAFEVELAPEFVPCGGDPVGLWTLTDMVGISDTLELVNETVDPSVISTCLGEVVAASEFSFVLELLAGGTGFGQMTQQEVTSRYADACLRRGTTVSCESGDRGTEACQLSDCGLCTCTFSNGGGGDDELHWQTEGTTLQFSLPTVQVGEYCVDGDTLTLRLEPSRAVYTFKKGYRAGTPLPCAERPLDKCQQADCFFGQCGGGEHCLSANDEVDCTGRPGCSWGPPACLGEANARCDILDYDVTPGCTVELTPPLCVGAPLPCAQQPSCAAVPGCTLEQACSGTPTACEQLDSITCDQAAGCRTQAAP